MLPAPPAEFIDKHLTLDVVRITEAAALAASNWTGKGDGKAADKAAVDAMRQTMDYLSIKGCIVIGEGERDEAPMLYIGEQVGRGDGPTVDIAVDPLEGTTLCAIGAPNALAVMAMAEQGNLLHAPDVYMQKIAVGGGLPEHIVSLDNSAKTNVEALAKAKQCATSDITVVILERPRHEELIAKTREAGARVYLIPDGDVAAVIASAMRDTDIDMYVGTGGAPEGVLAAAALRCLGGYMQGRLIFPSSAEIVRAQAMGIKHAEDIYLIDDMAKGDVIFAATGVTDGALLKGIKRNGSYASSHSVVMRSKTGTVRIIEAHHDLSRKTWWNMPA